MTMFWLLSCSKPETWWWTSQFWWPRCSHRWCCWHDWSNDRWLSTHLLLVTYTNFVLFQPRFVCLSVNTEQVYSESYESIFLTFFWMWSIWRNDLVVRFWVISMLTHSSVQQRWAACWMLIPMLGSPYSKYTNMCMHGELWCRFTLYECPLVISGYCCSLVH